ncbi:MAG: polyphenol oxidase family protein [Candidatus Doudnabacteria bacterium]|nr:polyphenol oxidase family protein [Candidatus Doudnabacteria bacterium]
MQLLAIRPKVFAPHPEVATVFAVGKLKFGIAPRAEVIAERRELLQTLQLDTRELRGLEQNQTDKAFYFDEANKSDFLSEPQLVGDALYTDCPGIFLSVTSGDCLPILFYNPVAGIAGAFHAGWPGTAKRTLAKVLQRVLQRCPGVGNYKFYFGPAAQACCYEITRRPEREEIFEKEFGAGVIARRAGKVYLDFVKANKIQLLDLGAGEGQVENSGICTIHNLEYPSYRRQRQNRTESLLSLIGVKR